MSDNNNGPNYCTRTLFNYQVCMQDGETSTQIVCIHETRGSSELSADLYRATLYKWRNEVQEAEEDEDKL